MRAWLAMMLGPVGLLGCGHPQFECEADDQCTLAAQGVCQPDARCSYPDADCPSGQRYSEHAGPVGGQCVGTTEATTGASSSSEGSSSTGPGDPCAVVDCGPQGQCEPPSEVDDEPRCVCDEGFVAQDLRCVQEGCPGSSCVWVDAVEGDDALDGTSPQTAVRTLARAAALAPTLEPGQALVLRRGQTWDEPLALAGLQGTEDEPIVVGAYGPGDGEGLGPLVAQGVTLDDSTGVRIQDLQIRKPGGTALRLSGVSHATVLGCAVSEASSGCIRVGAGSEYTAVVGNAAWSCGTSTYGIAIIEDGSGLGHHHWVLDNRIDGEGTTNALNITTTTADDVKVVRNYLRGSVDRGLHSRVSGHGWLVGNVVAQAGDANDAGIDHAGIGQVIARGNLVIDAALPVVLAGGGEWAYNTVLHQGTAAALSVPSSATGWSLHHNLVLPGSALALDVAATMDVQADDNVYGAAPGGGCSFEAGGMMLDLAGWQALGQDGRSRCEEVPGPAIPATIGSTRDWDDDGLPAAAVPDAAWPGCADPVGVFDCDGVPLAAGLPPFGDIGHGWEGPPEVRERVELVP